MRMIAALSNSEWGWRKYDLKKLFIAHISVIDYSGSAWQPWLSNTQIQKLDVAQNKALRLITRQSKTCPVESLRQEVQIPSMKSVITTASLKSREKALIFPEDHPRRIKLNEDPGPRLNARCSWRSSSAELAGAWPVEAENRREFKYYTVPPWEKDLGKTTITSDLPGISQVKTMTRKRSLQQPSNASTVSRCQ